MLQHIRERIQGWFAVVIIVLVALSFILFGIQSYLQADNPKLAVVAKVDGEKITAQQLQERTHRLLERTPNSNTLSDEARLELQQKALKQLLNEAALTQVAAASDLTVTPDELKAFIMTMPAFQVEGHFSLPRFQQVLLANGVGVQEFEQQIQQLLLLNQLQNAIESGAFSLPSEVQQRMALLKQKRDLGYFEITQSAQTEKSEATQEQIKKYYQDHQQDFMLPEQLSITYIELSPEKLAESIHLSDAEEQQYYQEHRANFPKTKNFAELKSSISTILRQEKAEQLLAEKAEELSNLTFTNPDNLEVAAKALKLPIQHSALFTQKGLPTGILSEAPVLQAAFSEEVLVQNNNSNPIELKGGGLMVLRVDQHQAAQAQALASVEKLIQTKLKAEQSETAAHDLAEQLKKELNAGVSSAELATGYHLVWKTVPKVSLDNQNLPASLVRAAFKISYDGASSQAVVVKLPKDAYAVLQITGHQWGPSGSLTEAELKTELSKATAEQAKIEYQLYEQGIQAKAKLKLKKENMPAA